MYILRAELVLEKHNCDDEVMYVSVKECLLDY